MALPRRGSSPFVFLLSLLPPVVWLAPAWLARQAPSFRDQGDFFYPLKLYTAQRLARGEIPLWNPFSGAGEPWLANLQAGVFYPPGAFFLLSSPALAAALFLLFHFWLGAWGTWRFLKEEAVSDSGALLGAAAFSASGLAASLSMYWNHFGAWAYLPAIAWLARSGLSSRGSRLGACLLIGFQAMAGSPEISAGTLLLGPFLAWQGRTQQSGWQEVTGRTRVLRFVVAAALGLGLAAWALVPFGELLLHSNRGAGLPVDQREVGAAHVEALRSVLGLSPGESGTTYLASLYIGPPILLAAAAAFAEKERRRLVLLLLILGAAGILLSMGSPPGTWLRSLPVVNFVRYPAKALAFSFFALSILSGFGVDAWRFRRVSVGRLWIVFAGLAGLTVVLLSPGDALRWISASSIFLLCLLAWTASPSRSAGAISALAVLTILAGLTVSSRRVFRFVSEAEVKRQSEELKFLARLPGRVLTPTMGKLASWVLRDASFNAGTLERQREALLGYTNLLSGVRTIRTAAALPTLGAVSIEQAIDRSPEVALPAGAASARVLWTPFQPPSMGSRKVGEFFRAPINPYRPRLSFVRAFRVEPDPLLAWSRAAHGEIDFNREVFLDRPPAVPIARDSTKPLLVARLAEDLPERVVADITSSGAGLLVLTDIAYPGWAAQTDGKPSELRRADGFFRAVPLSSGSHRVVFRYRPLTFYVGAAISVGTAATLLFLLWLRRSSDTRSLL